MEGKTKKRGNIVEKRERFMKMAPIRVNNVLKHLRLVKNLLNKNNYKYEPEEFSKIINDISEEFRILKNKFEEQKKGRDKWKL
tara:strand:- start:182 stop:430 length:249 start_codon:yes stop_codon:yes gene_type:complete